MRDTLLVDKPEGMTSYGVVRRLKKTLGASKIGHGGTLDPLASGLLIVGFGAGTKRLHEFLHLPKVYVADIMIGERRDTGDREGVVIETVANVSIHETQVRAALASMEGELALAVPAYSAVKQGGEPLYKKARRGERVAPPVKMMRVHAAELLQLTEVGENRVCVRAAFDVGGGTYIRSLAEELGRRLGYPATLYGLRRTRIGDYSVEDAQTLEELCAP